MYFYLFIYFRCFFCLFIRSISIDAIIKADIVQTVPLTSYAASSNGASVGVGSALASQSSVSAQSSSSLASSSVPLSSLTLASSATETLEKSNLPNDFYIGPYLDGNEMTNITVQIGTNAYLPCKVCVYIIIDVIYNLYGTGTHINLVVHF